MIPSLAAAADAGFWSANLPDWLAGVGTVATAGISVFLLWRERGDRERQREREALAEDSARRAQAALVSLSIPTMLGGSGRSSDFWEVAYGCGVTNGSSQTISDVIVYCTLFNPDGTEAVRHIQVTRRVAPENTATSTTPKTRMPWIPDAGDYKAESEAEFTDAAGLRWRRDAQHRLSEISPISAPGAAA